MNCSAGETMKQLNKKSLRHQVGASKFGLLMIFILLAVFFTFGLKVVPLYVDHNLVTGICKKLIENGEAENMTVNYIRQRVLNTLRINNITDFNLSSITLRKESDQAIISIAYEHRVDLKANLDVVAKFDTVLR
jgi:hypothetical protein